MYFSQNPGRELAVNAPVFTLLIRDRGCAIKTGFSEPLKFHFKQKVKDNRTSPQCVYWKTSTHNVCNHTDSGSDHRSVSCLYEENSISICQFLSIWFLIRAIDYFFFFYQSMNDYEVHTYFTFNIYVFLSVR